MISALLPLLLIAIGDSCFALSRETTLKEYACDAKQCQGDNEYKIVHVKSFIRGNTTDDTIHYVWAAISIPTMIVAHGTNASTVLVIDWSAIAAKNASMATALRFDPPVHSISALAIGSLFEYIDVKDSVDPFQEGNTIKQQIMSDFKWNLVHVDNTTCMASFMANSTGKHTNGSAEFQMRAYSSSGHRTDWPHETYNANSSEFTFTMKGLSAHYKQSRYFVEVLFYTENKVTELAYETDKSLDDEYTPGIFKLWKLAIPTHHIPSFASWKPVAYTSPARNREQQTFAYNFPSGVKGQLKQARSDPWSLAAVTLVKPMVFGSNVSFGMPGDEWYSAYNYVSWTGLVGLGSPPQEAMSAMVITVIIVGLGVPAFFIIIGFGVVVIRRLRNSHRSNYDRIN